jgi:hypothetical protein
MNSASGDGGQSERSQLYGSTGREGCAGGGVLLCMCDSEATFHCVSNRSKMGTQKVIRVEEKVVFEYSLKVWLVHEDLVSPVEHCTL